MNALTFVAWFGAALYALLFWGFRALPKEKWQVLATIPVRKDGDSWRGINLTYYGFFVATGVGIAGLLFFTLLGSVGVAPAASMFVLVAIMAVSMPAASWVARVVEKKQHTFTVAGAFFVGVVAFPVVIMATNRFLSPLWGYEVPFAPMLAATAIAYAVGEGIGRLACISFGCCYGKRIEEAPSALRGLFARWNVVFHGKTKKVAYAHNLEGVKIVPIQAMTAIVYVTTALVGSFLFLRGQFVASILVTIPITQVWRVVSEFLRADYRGEGTWSRYQILSMLVVLIVVVGVPFLSSAAVSGINIDAGLDTVWNPLVLIALQLGWWVTFLRMGRSMVTDASVTIGVRRDRV